MSSYYTEYRPDGWPLCPQCGEDELWSKVMIAWMGQGERPTMQQCVEGEMTCYACNWNSWREKLNQPEWPTEITE